MKKKLLYGLLGAAGGLGLAGSMVSCSDNYNPSTDADGQILLSLNLDKDVVASAANKQSAPSSRADAQSVSASDLSLKLTSESGAFSRFWATASEFDGPEQVPVGKYTLEAFYGDLNEEGFEKPYYYGTSSLSVEENRTTQVAVTATLANSMVRIEMSDMFRSYFESYTVAVRSELGTEHPYSGSETRPLYLAPGQITTTISITKKNGTTATLEPKSFTAEPRHSYLLKFDVNSGEAGEGQLTLTYDDMTDIEEVEIDLSDAILNAPAPRLNTEGFTDGETWTVMAGQPSAKQAKVSALAQGGIDGVILSTSSQYLESQGWPTEIDLVSGDPAKIAMMQGLGLRVIGVTRPDKMAMVDFTELLSNIQYLDGGNNNSTFTVLVRDKNQRVAENPVSFSVETVTTTLSIAKVYPIYEWATTLELDIETNAADIAGLAVQTKNDRNTWDNAEIKSCEAVAGQNGIYHLTVTVPSSTTDFDVKVVLGSLTETAKVTHIESPYSLAAVENGIYGWQAALDLKYQAGASSAARRRSASRSAETPENVTFELSTDNGQTWRQASASALATNRYLLKGLTGGQAYQVRATCDGVISRVFSFTTETGSQLENSDMETWFRTDGIKGSWPNNGIYWWKYYPAASADSGIWGTMNLLTTSYTGTRDYTAYCNFSGTSETTDAHSGQKAAIIETVGWGANAAQAWWTDTKNITVGQLYLGSYNSSTKLPDYGVAYASRPGSLEFWYKYTAKNSADYGKATVKVLDADNNVLAEKETTLTATDSYSRQTLDLTSLYSVPCNKAAKIQIIFLSSGHPDVLSQNNENWLSRPPFGNLSDGRFTGSSLYIDDIKLNF